jgi:putative peptidoglycan lipid II flippase
MVPSTLRRFFATPASSVASAAFIIGLLSIASRLLGIVRDRILASSFGAGTTLDMYYAAFRLPDLVFNLLVLGALSAGFIPVFAKLAAEKNQRQAAWHLANNIFHTLAFALIIICGLGIIFSPALTQWIAPGFKASERETISILTRIMFLSPFFLGLSSIAGSILQSFHKFFVYSLAPVLYNLGIIAGVVFFVPDYGIYGLAWGVVLGSLVHFAIQLPALAKLGFQYRFIFNLRDRALRSVYAMMTARTLGLAITQLNLIVITILASGLVEGSLAVFNLANNLQSFAIGIFGISFAVAVFPLLSTAESDEVFINRFSKTFRQILFCIIPATVVLIILRAQIVRVILGSGNFGWEDTIMTIDTVGYFALSLFAQATIPLLARAFYARHDSKTPFYVGLFSAVANVALSVYLAPSLGVAGLALAFSAGMILNFLLLFIILHRRLRSLDEKRIIVSIAKCSAAAIGMAVTIQAMKLLIWPYVDMTRFWGILLQGSLAGLFGLLVYFAVCSLLKSEEFNELWSATKIKLFDSAKKLKSDDQGEVHGI